MSSRIAWATEGGPGYIQLQQERLPHTGEAGHSIPSIINKVETSISDKNLI